MTTRFRKIKVIGQGGFGKVYEAIDIQSGETVALKEMYGDFVSWDQCCNLTEVKALQFLTHPNIVTLKEVILENQKLYLVYELLDKDLYKLIDKKRKNREKIEEEQIKVFMFQLLKAVSFIHKKGYFHRDLKPENIVLRDENLLKLTDFGILKEASTIQYGPFTEYISTRWYRAPELILKSTKYDYKIDMFAIGCIMAELYLLIPIFPGTSALDQMTKVVGILGTPDRSQWEEGYALSETKGVQIPQGVPKRDLRQLLRYASTEAIDLIEQLFKYNPNDRPNCDQALEHPFFSSVNQKHLISKVNNMSAVDDRSPSKKHLNNQIGQDFTSELRNDFKEQREQIQREINDKVYYMNQKMKDPINNAYTSYFGIQNKPPLFSKNLQIINKRNLSQQNNQNIRMNQSLNTSINNQSFSQKYENDKSPLYNNKVQSYPQEKPESRSHQYLKNIGSNIITHNGSSYYQSIQEQRQQRPIPQKRDMSVDDFLSIVKAGNTIQKKDEFDLFFKDV